MNAPTKIDLGLDCHDWQPAGDLAPLIGIDAESTNLIANAATSGYRCNGYTVERRDATERERESFGMKGRARFLYRVKREGVDLGIRKAQQQQGTPSPELTAFREALEQTRRSRDGLKAELENARGYIAELEEKRDSQEKLIRELSEDLDTARCTPEAQAPPAVVGRPTKDVEAFLWDLVAGEVENPTKSALALLRSMHEGR